MIKKVMYLYSLTSLHPGVGSTPEIVDLPVQREKHTGFPVIFGSSLKGAIRDNFEKNIANALFGNEDMTGNNAYASAVSLSDARVLLFPVKSLKGTFVYVTCPFILRRYERDLKIMGINSFSGQFQNDKVYISDEADDILINDKLVLEEYSYNDLVNNNDIVKNLGSILSTSIFPAGMDKSFEYWNNKMKNHIVIVPDDDFKYFVQHSTEIVTRIKVNGDTGVVEEGALWTEENLPSDALFYSIVIIDKTRGGKEWEENEVLAKVSKVLDGKSIHIGGNTTIGRGFVLMSIPDSEQEDINKGDEGGNNGD